MNGGPIAADPNPFHAPGVRGITSRISGPYTSFDKLQTFCFAGAGVRVFFPGKDLCMMAGPGSRLLTRYEPGNALHRAMFEAFSRVFAGRLAAHPVGMTRAVEPSGRFLSSVYETDNHDMTRETRHRARARFDRAYGAFSETILPHWQATANGTLSADKVKQEGIEA